MLQFKECLEIKYCRAIAKTIDLRSKSQDYQGWNIINLNIWIATSLVDHLTYLFTRLKVLGN